MKYNKSPEFKEIIEDMENLVDMTNIEEIKDYREEFNEAAKDIFDIEFDIEDYIKYN